MRLFAAAYPRFSEPLHIFAIPVLQVIFIGAAACPKYATHTRVMHCYNMIRSYAPHGVHTRTGPVASRSAYKLAHMQFLCLFSNPNPTYIYKQILYCLTKTYV